MVIEKGKPETLAAPSGVAQKPQEPGLLANAILAPADQARSLESGRASHLYASRFQPGQSGNPSGVPKDFISASQAYKVISLLPLEQIKDIQKGIFPKDWGPRKPIAMYCMAAGQFLSAAEGATTGPTSRTAPSTPAAMEIANRTEGKVPDRVSVEHRGVIALPLVQLDSDAWALECQRDMEQQAQELEALEVTGVPVEGALAPETPLPSLPVACEHCGQEGCITHPRVSL